MTGVKKMESVCGAQELTGVPIESREFQSVVVPYLTKESRRYALAETLLLGGLSLSGVSEACKRPGIKPAKQSRPKPV